MLIYRVYPLSASIYCIPKPQFTYFKMGQMLLMHLFGFSFVFGKVLHTIYNKSALYILGLNKLRKVPFSDFLNQFWSILPNFAVTLLMWSWLAYQTVGLQGTMSFAVFLFSSRACQNVWKILMRMEKKTLELFSLSMTPPMNILRGQIKGKKVAESTQDGLDGQAAMQSRTRSFFFKFLSRPFELKLQ